MDVPPAIRDSLGDVRPQHEEFHAQALRTPDAEAVTDGDVSFTYGTKHTH